MGQHNGDGFLSGSSTQGGGGDGGTADLGLINTQTIFDFFTGTPYTVGVDQQGQFAGLYGAGGDFRMGGQFFTLTGQFYDIVNGQVASQRTLTSSEREALGLSVAPGAGGGGGGGGFSGGGSRASTPFSQTQEAFELTHQQNLEIENIRHENELDRLREQERLARERGRLEDARRFRQQMRLERIRHRQALGILRREQRFTAEQNELARENELRLTLLGMGGQLAQSAAELQQQAQQLRAQTQGQDPFRAAALMTGAAPQGTTPSQMFQQQLSAVAGAELPAFTATSDIPQLFSQVSDLGEFVTGGLPTAPQFGFARGGTMKKGRSGAFEPKTDEAGKAVLVGERGPEVMILDEDEVRIVPLMATAQRGLRANRPQEDRPDPPTEERPQPPAPPASNPPPPPPSSSLPPSDFPQSPFAFGQSAAAALAPVFQHLGLPGAAFAAQSPTGGIFGPFTFQGGPIPRFQPGAVGSTLSALGVRPRLVRNSATGETFFIQNGMVRPIGGPVSEFGFGAGDVVNVSPQELFAAGQTSGLTMGAPLTDTPLPGAGARPFSALSAPLIEPTTGLLLPDPGQIASIWRTLPPALQNSLLSAYGTAGLQEEDVSARLNFFTPTGTLRTPSAALLR